MNFRSAAGEESTLRSLSVFALVRRVSDTGTDYGAARKIEFAERIQADLGRPVVPTNINRFPLPPNQWLFPRVPSRQEGRIAIVTNARRDVVDAAASGARSCLQGGFGRE